MSYSLIKNAILNKQQVHATYHGFRRLMCPHAIGTKNGKNQALFYQFGGESSQGTIVSPSPSNWRCIPIDTLTDIQIVGGQWHTYGNHSTPSKCIDTIDVEVAY